MHAVFHRRAPHFLSSLMKIPYLSQYFPPEIGATQIRAYEMAQGLVRAGHRVTMIAEVPNHPSGIIPAEYQAKFCERTDQWRGKTGSV